MKSITKKVICALLSVFILSSLFVIPNKNNKSFITSIEANAAFKPYNAILILDTEIFGSSALKNYLYTKPHGTVIAVFDERNGAAKVSDTLEQWVPSSLIQKIPESQAIRLNNHNHNNHLTYYKDERLGKDKDIFAEARYYYNEFNTYGPNEFYSKYHLKNDIKFPRSQNGYSYNEPLMFLESLTFNYNKDSTYQFVVSNLTYSNYEYKFNLYLHITYQCPKCREKVTYKCFLRTASIRDLRPLNANEADALNRNNKEPKNNYKKK